MYQWFKKAVEVVVQKFRVAKVKLEAFKRYIPHCGRGPASQYGKAYVGL